MDLSTSGASIHARPILSDLSPRSSDQVSGSSSNPLRKALLANRHAAAAATPAGFVGGSNRIAQALDESALSCSGMSLVSLGSLSRSAWRLDMLNDDDEALDDPEAWLNALTNSNSTAEDQERRPDAYPGALAPTGGADGSGSRASHRKSNSDRRRACLDTEGGNSATVGGLTGTASLPHGCARSAGYHRDGAIDSDIRVQQLSIQVAELRRQQSYAGRLVVQPPPPPAGVDLAPIPPPPPVGVDLAPPPPAVGRVSPVIPDTFTTAGGHVSNPPWASGSAVAGAVRGGGGDSCDQAADRGERSSGGINSSGSSTSGRSSSDVVHEQRKIRRAGIGRALLRTLGIAAAKNGEGAPVASTGAASTPVGGREVDLASATNGWSNDSSLQGRRDSSSSANAIGPCAGSLPHDGRAARAKSVPSAATSVAAGVMGVGSDKSFVSGTGGVRERFAGVWGGHRWIGSHRNAKKEAEHGIGDFSQGSTMAPTADVGGLEFLDKGQSELGPEPAAYPDWFRGHSAPAGSADDGNPQDFFAGTFLGPPFGASPFLGTPLGASDRSFDPNLAMSPLPYDADNSGLSIARSFDPNSSVKSLFDTSTSWRTRSVPRNTPQEQDDHQTLGFLRGSRLPPLPASSSSVMSEPPMIARGEGTTASGVTATTTPTAIMMVTKLQGADDEKQTALEAAAALLEDDRLAQDMSDLSLSGTRDGDGSPSRRRRSARRVDPMEFSDASVAAFNAEGSKNRHLQQVSSSGTLGSSERSPTASIGGASWLRANAFPGSDLGATTPAVGTESALEKDNSTTNAANGTWQPSTVQPREPMDDTAGRGRPNSWPLPLFPPVLSPDDHSYLFGAVGAGSIGVRNGIAHDGPVPANANSLGVFRAQSADVDTTRWKSRVQDSQCNWAAEAPGHVMMDQGTAFSLWRSDRGIELNGNCSASSLLNIPPTAAASTALGMGRSFSADNTDHSTSRPRSDGLVRADGRGLAGGSSSVRLSDLSCLSEATLGRGRPAHATLLQAFATAPPGIGSAVNIPACAAEPTAHERMDAVGSTGAGTAPVSAVPPPWWSGLSTSGQGRASNSHGEVCEAQGLSLSYLRAHDTGVLETGGASDVAGAVQSASRSGSICSEGKPNEAWSALQAMIPLPGLAKPKPQAHASNDGNQIGADVGAAAGGAGGGAGIVNSCGSIDAAVELGLEHDGKDKQTSSGSSNGWGVWASSLG